MSAVKFNRISVRDFNVVMSDFALETQIFGRQSDNVSYMMEMNGTGDILFSGSPTNNAGATNAGAVIIYVRNSSDIWTFRQKIQASDLTAQKFFGRSVACNSTGSTLVVGSAATTATSDHGSAYIFKKNASDLWLEHQRIIASDSSSSSRFGYDVSINNAGDLVAVGANGNDTRSSDNGAAYIFTKNASDIWSQKQQLLPSDADVGAVFGSSLILNAAGTTLTIGAPSRTGTNPSQGAVYIFRKNASDIWYQNQPYLVTSDTVDISEFGNWVDTDDTGDISVIACPNNSILDTGVVYVFMRNTSDIWIEKDRLIVSDYNFPPNNQSGYGSIAKISANGNYIFTSATHYPESDGGDDGRGYIFSRTSSDTWNNYGVVRYNQSSPTASNFGTSIAIDDTGYYAVYGRDPAGVSYSDLHYYHNKLMLSDSYKLITDIVTDEVFIHESDAGIRLKYF